MACFNFLRHIDQHLVSCCFSQWIGAGQLASIRVVATIFNYCRSDAGIPYISLCTDPTTGGTTASFAMLGDINIAEPGALIGFAGPRVVQDTTGQELPEGFQTSEFLLEHGFLDFISERKYLKNVINQYIDLITNQPLRA